jgi:HlyD family secretion protein
VTFTPAERDDVLRVPNAALRYHPEPPAGSAGSPGSAPKPPPAPTRKDRRTVYRLNGTTVTPVEIQPGLTDGSVTEVAGGDVHEGDALITEMISDSPPSGGGAPMPGMPRRM